MLDVKLLHREGGGDKEISKLIKPTCSEKGIGCETVRRENQRELTFGIFASSGASKGDSAPTKQGSSGSIKDCFRDLVPP